jgi:hypothetical protein
MKRARPNPASIAAELADRPGVSALSNLRLSLKGVAPVNEAAWAEHWSDPVLDALLATGRYKLDRGGGSKSASAIRSAMKVAVIAITNRFPPDASEIALKDFVRRVRPEIVRAGLIGSRASGRPRATAVSRAIERMEELSRQEQSAARYLATAPDGRDLIAQIRELAANYEFLPMCFAGRLSHLNVLLDVALHRPTRFDELVGHKTPPRRGR